VSLLELQEGFRHELRVNIQGMQSPFLAVSPPCRYTGWLMVTRYLSRFRSRASSTVKGNQSSTSRGMAL
jgi:hypothetical protein